MLTLHKVSALRAGAYAAYLTDVEATGDYAVGPEGDPLSATGRWLGGLAEEWGMARTAVDEAALLAVLDGRDPRSGKRIVRVWRADRVAAHDLVFSAPSSVSAAWALVGEELRAAIQQAQDAAVAEAFTHIEREFALVRRREQGVVISEPAAALLGAAFTHHTSRQTAAQADAGVPPDPQLHTHVLLPGMARRQDGAHVAISSLELHRRQGEAGIVYRDALATGLESLGFHVERATGNGGRYFELTGVPVELRETWSSRHREVKTAARQWRREFRAARGRDPSVTEERDRAAKSRTSKARYERGELFTFWRDTAAYLGVTPETVEALRLGGDVKSAPVISAQSSHLPPSRVDEAVAAHFGHRWPLISDIVTVANRLSNIVPVLTGHVRRVVVGCQVLVAAWVHLRQETDGEPVEGHNNRIPEYRRVTLPIEPGIAQRPESVEPAALRP